MRDFSCLGDKLTAKAIIMQASGRINPSEKHQSVKFEGIHTVDLSRINGSETEYQATLRLPSGAIWAMAIV